MGVAYWVEQMARDTDKAELEFNQEKLNKDLERFMKTAVGAEYRPKSGNNWIGSRR
jgi:hypothetical protein